MGVPSRRGAGRRRSPVFFRNNEWHWPPVPVYGNTLVADGPGRGRRVLSYVVFYPSGRPGDRVVWRTAVRSAVRHLVEGSSSTDNIDFDLPVDDPAAR